MRHFLALTIAAVLAATLAAAASADRAYHTERLALRGLNGAPGGGMVVNAHPNGPIVYAHEIYVLNGATVGTYQERSTSSPRVSTALGEAPPCRQR
jgi:hypothetical protein